MEQPLPRTLPPLLSRNVVSAFGRTDSRPAAEVRNRRRALQRRAWQWALANHRPDGSLHTGTEVARQFRRSERWGRLVKKTGLSGQLGTST